MTTSDYRDLFAPSAPKLVTTALGSPGTVNFVLAMNLVDESEFTDAVTLVSGPTTVEPGKTYTWQVDIEGAANVYAILYPQPAFVGGAARTSTGPATITLTVPATTKTGAHKLTFSTYVDRGEGSELLRQYLPITVAAPAVIPPAPALAATGVSAETGFFGLLALIFISLGGALLWMSRRSTRAGVRAQR